MEDDHFHDECGVFGIFNHPEAAYLTYLGLYGLQHRGQESCGICTNKRGQLEIYKDAGLVPDVFRNPHKLQRLKGNHAIGHVRYSTTGGADIKNAQPILIESARGQIALAHNGNLTNYHLLRSELENSGSIFWSNSDSEIFLHLVVKSPHSSFEKALEFSLTKVEGAYSLVLLTEKGLIATRDIYGVRPLCLGKLGDAYIVSSESCALDLLEATFIREIEPGEVVYIDNHGLRSHFPYEERTPRPCIFEHIYFARPDSYMFGRSVQSVRKELGKQMARERPVDADIVVPIPDSGVAAALGYSEESGIPFEMGIIRNHYIGRTFIEPEATIRHLGVKVKLNPDKGLLRDKRIVLIDDSIVRGTTSRKLVEILRHTGVKEIHFRISSPPITHSCFYGIDTPKQESLIASQHSVEKIEEILGVDTLAYLSMERMLEAAKNGHCTYCTACFDGNYCVKQAELKIRQLELALAN